MKKKHYSNFCTFEIASLVNVPEHYLRKYGILVYVSEFWILNMAIFKQQQVTNHQMDKLLPWIEVETKRHQKTPKNIESNFWKYLYSSCIQIKFSKNKLACLQF